MGHSRPLFAFSSFSHYNLSNTNWKKHRWCAWDSNPRPQDGRRGPYHRAMSAALQLNDFVPDRCSKSLLASISYRKRQRQRELPHRRHLHPERRVRRTLAGRRLRWRWWSFWSWRWNSSTLSRYKSWTLCCKIFVCHSFPASSPFCFFLFSNNFTTVN